jgi:hypothetical protein
VDDLLKLLHARLASAAIGASTARRMIPAGTIPTVRTFLATEVGLSRLRPPRYPQTLDDLTDALLARLPKKARPWGAARKFLNIFIRDAAYNVYLSSAYPLERLVPHLEVPLDSEVARGLKQDARELGLPRTRAWPGVKNLLREDSDALQAIAASVVASGRYGVTERVHLDVVYWRAKEREARNAPLAPVERR